MSSTPKKVHGCKDMKIWSFRVIRALANIKKIASEEGFLKTHPNTGFFHFIVSTPQQLELIVQQKSLHIEGSEILFMEKEETEPFVQRYPLLRRQLEQYRYTDSIILLEIERPYEYKDDHCLLGFNMGISFLIRK